MPTPKIEKRCPEGHPLVVRVNRETEGEFLGCSQWPDCKYTEKLPEYIRLKLLGGQELPGFE